MSSEGYRLILEAREKQRCDELLAQLQPTSDGTCFWVGCQAEARTTGTMETPSDTRPYALCTSHFIELSNAVVQLERYHFRDEDIQ